MTWTLNGECRELETYFGTQLILSDADNVSVREIKKHNILKIDDAGYLLDHRHL